MVFPSGAIIVKVLAFSLDPVMRVWLSGAKTNYPQVHAGDIFNCFGLGIIEKSNSEDFPVNSYLFGNTGTVSYFELTEQKQRECFLVDKQLV
jgi:NADPH-dependent curcumin reductase CurA